ncbi:type IV pilus twitching motility protein PilT [Planctomycetes bacterium K23_9]|uniref:Twitching mobility protein n=1 Tax=Stieleria marina TaxID=1930275 RepID=A0A517NVE8_9BACT|nr:Twitching mobility protein [Planctomycetes bacterium K23_9]
MNKMSADKRIVDWLLRATDLGASDLHVVAGFPPTVRVHGKLQPLSDEMLDGPTAQTLLESLCDEEQTQQFRTAKNLDFAPVIDRTTAEVQSSIDRCIDSDGSCKAQRFRANYFLAGSQIGGCFRVIPNEIPDVYWAGFPPELADTLTRFRNGLILFTGITGSGKSTSLAMMIRRLVEAGGRRIITIEEPIEYVFDHTHGSLVTQREVGHDVDSFADGLKFGLRQDPDIILVGEIRDRETAQIALSASETGHLIFATLHTRDAKGAISRFSDLFSQSSQSEVRSQLALSLRAVISQHLLPSSLPDQKRELALEVLFNTTAIAAAIRQGKVESIDNCIQTSKADGMYLLDDSIRSLLQENRISRETAEQFVSDRRSLN